MTTATRLKFDVVLVFSLIASAVGGTWTIMSHVEQCAKEIRRSFEESLERHIDDGHRSTILRDEHHRDLHEIRAKISRLEDKIDRLIEQKRD